MKIVPAITGKSSSSKSKDKDSGKGSAAGGDNSDDDFADAAAKEQELVSAADLGATSADGVSKQELRSIIICCNLVVHASCNTFSFFFSFLENRNTLARSAREQERMTAKLWGPSSLSAVSFFFFWFS